MDPTILVAIITAVTSLLAALIGAYAQIMVARIQRQPRSDASRAPTSPRDTQPAQDAVPPRSARTGVLPGSPWWISGSILLLVALLLPLVGGSDDLALVSIYLTVPICTLVLAIARPIFWGYVAAFVTVLDGAALVGSYLQSPGHLGVTELIILLRAYVPTVVVCSAAAYLRLRTRKSD